MSRLTKAADKILRQGMNSMKFQSVEHRILANSKLLKVEPGYVETIYKIDAENEVNPMGMMHGGVTATLIDSITTWCCFFHRDGIPGVTTDLSVSYLKGIDPKKHPSVKLIGKVEQGGKTLTFASGEIRSEDGSILFATGKQTKFMHSVPGPINVVGYTNMDQLLSELDEEA